MKRPASSRSLLTVPFAIPAYWTPHQALAVELLDGLRELIWGRYGWQLLDERWARLQPLADSLLEPRRRKKIVPPNECMAHLRSSPTARRGAPLAVRGLDGECGRQATIVVPTMRPHPTARLRTATAMLYSARVVEPQAPLRPLGPRSPANIGIGSPLKYVLLLRSRTIALALPRSVGARSNAEPVVRPASARGDPREGAGSERPVRRSGWLPDPCYIRTSRSRARCSAASSNIWRSISDAYFALQSRDRHRDLRTRHVARGALAQIVGEPTLAAARSSRSQLCCLRPVSSGSRPSPPARVGPYSPDRRRQLG
jgi:hypothetical protein